MRKRTMVFSLLTCCLLVSCSLLRPERQCKVESMLLSKDDFPAGTIINETSSPIAERPNESAGFTSNYGGSAMYHEVSRFPITISAENEFIGAKKQAYPKTEFLGPWDTPVELARNSSIFQNYYVACGKVGKKYQCRIIGQYDEYYMFFFAYILDNGVTFDILNGLLQKIDDRMAQCLQK